MHAGACWGHPAHQQAVQPGAVAADYCYAPGGLAPGPAASLFFASSLRKVGTQALPCPLPTRQGHLLAAYRGLDCAPSTNLTDLTTKKLCSCLIPACPAAWPLTSCCSLPLPLLQYDPADRPTIDEILACKAVQSRMAPLPHLVAPADESWDQGFLPERFRRESRKVVSQGLGEAPGRALPLVVKHCRECLEA